MNTTGNPKFRPLTNELQAIGNNLRFYRLRRKMTQQQLGQMVGYDWPKQIYNIEKGRSMPSVIMLARLCKVLGVPADKLLEGIE